MLGPMLRVWLDANLPDMVERIVAREIAKIAGTGQ
jgi:cell pole-organizing protein PopZ